jgi:hypothetical protein
MTTSVKANRRTVSLLFALLTLGAILPIAAADLGETILTITASTGRAEGTLEISQSDGQWDGDNFFWSVDHPLDICAPDGSVIGQFGPASVAFYADPQVYLGFSIQATDSATAFTLTSALLSFPTMPSALARADAAFTLQDFMGFGATLVGAGPGGGAYLTQYNGYVPGGTTFGEGIPFMQVLPPAILTTANYASDPLGQFLPIGSASDMSSQIAFTLSPFAFASGSANYEIIIPEPTALLLMVAGLMVARRR